MKGLIIKTKRLIIGSVITLMVISLLPARVYAQQAFTGETGKIYQISLLDGSSITGRLILITDQEIVIQSASMGEIRLMKTNIKSMSFVSDTDIKKSGIWFQNPNPSKYLLGNSAIPMEKKTGYYQNTWIFINTFSYAFTRNFSISAGFEIFSILADGEGPYAFYINPKMSFKVANNFYLGGNILYANTIKTVEEFGGLATINGFGTYGNKNNNITGALGWGWADGVFSPRPLIVISGMTRASKRIAFVTENWLVPNIDDGGYYGVISYGIRFLGEKTSIDLAFVNNRDIAEEVIIGIPWLDFVVNF